MTCTVTQGPFRINTDPALLDIDFIHHFLSEQSYWAKGIPRTTVERSIQNSLCFGLYHEQQQIGFARVITDKATFGYLADVFISTEFRGQGLSKWLMETIIAHPELQGFRRHLLATADAHSLYAQFGYNGLKKPDRWMEKHNPDVYQ